MTVAEYSQTRLSTRYLSCQPALRSGVTLIIVLVLIAMLSLGAYSFTNLMLAQQRGVVMTGRRAQAQAAVLSGVEYLKDYLAMTTEEQVGVGGHYDNPAYFKDVVVVEEPEGPVRFSIISVIADDYGEPTGVRFGLEDESGKINVNELATSDLYAEGSDVAAGGSQTPGAADAGADPAADPSADAMADEEGAAASDPRRDALMGLPGMTESIADSILDFIDSDEEPRVFGAEAESYGFARYAPRNGPIDSLDELLLVSGVTPELLFGADRNHNGLIDPDEQSEASGMAGGNGSMARGWSAFLTVRSVVKPAETELIDLNQEDLQALYDAVLDAGFDADTATYIVAYRQTGPYAFSDPNQPSDDGSDNGATQPEVEIEGVSGRTVDLTQAGGNQFASVLDLIDSYTQAKFAGEEDPNAAGGTEGNGSGGTDTGGDTGNGGGTGNGDTGGQGGGGDSGGGDSSGGGGGTVGGGTGGGSAGGGQATPIRIIQSPFSSDSGLSTILPQLMSSFTAGDSGNAGRINMNQASQPTLSSIPTLEDTLVPTILGQRDATSTSGDKNYLYPTWPLALGIMTLEQMKTLLPYVSSDGAVFRAQVVGYSDTPGVFARAEVVIDASDGTAKLVSWRNLSHLDAGSLLDSFMSP